MNTDADREELIRLREENESLKTSIQLLETGKYGRNELFAKIGARDEALADCRKAIIPAIAVIENHIRVAEMLKRSPGPWPDVLSGCVSGDGLVQALATINTILGKDK